MLSFVLLSVASNRAVAHPHTWINVEAAILIEDGAVRGLRYVWRFSRDYLDGLKAEYDTNRDGVVSDDELQAWLALSTKNLEAFKYFTILRYGREIVAIEGADDFRVDKADDGLALYFTVRLARPANVKAGALQIDIWDPTFFTEFVLGDGRGVTVEGTHASKCSAVVAPAPGSDQQKAITAFMKAFGRIDAKLSPAKAISVTCKD